MTYPKKYGFWPYQNNYREGYWTLAAAQTGATGDVCAINASGLLEVAGAASTAVLGVLAGPVTTASAATKVPVWEATATTLFVGRISGTYTAAADLDFCDIEGTTGAMLINEDASATELVQIHSLCDDYADIAGDDVPVVFNFVKRQLDTEV